MDGFDRRIIDVLRGGGRRMTLVELVEASGFARSTVVIHLERFGTEGLLLREKMLSKGRGRPRFLYRLAATSTPKLPLLPVSSPWSSRISERPADTRKAATANS